MTRKRPRLRAKTVAVLYALEGYLQGLTSEDLASRVGISTRSVAARARWLQRTGLAAYAPAERVWTLTDWARRDFFKEGVRP